MRALVVVGHLAVATLATLCADPLGLARPALACSQTSKILWSQPDNANDGIPADGVLRVLIGAGDSARDDFSVTLENAGGEALPAIDDIVEHPGNTPYETRYLHTLTPRDPLQPGVRYTLQIRHASGEPTLGRTVWFDALEPRGGSLEATPRVTVLSAYLDQGEGDTGCDFDEVKVYEVSVTPAQADDERLGVLHLYRLADESDTWHYQRALQVDASAASRTEVFRVDTLNQWGGCFLAVQEDAVGNQSPVSALACSPEPLRPDEGGDTGGAVAPVGDSGSACRGCASGGGAAGMAALALGLLAAVGRRAGRGAPPRVNCWAFSLVEVPRRWFGAIVGTAQ